MKFIRNFFYAFIFLFIFLGISHAYKEDTIAKRTLTDSTNGDWESLTMSSTTATYTSTGINITNCKGFTSLLVVIDTTTYGSFAITYQVSMDNTNWYTPYDTDGNALNVISAALTASRWISFDPELALFIRFIFILSTTNTEMSAYLIYQE